MKQGIHTTQALPAYITKSASKQTYYTFLFLTDRKHRTDAYRSYAYFRWVDDILDKNTGTMQEKVAFIQRQKNLLEACYHDGHYSTLNPQEWMLVDLVRNNCEQNSGLHVYLHNMMEVMSFDVIRRNRTISEAELSEYTRLLATAVTELMFYFIGPREKSAPADARYLSVTAAHITHMLRDTFEDIKAGYFNISSEYLQANRISPFDFDSPAYREWVYQRVQLAKNNFKSGRLYLSEVKSWRIRLAGLAYTARFEWVLQQIERDNYRLRDSYAERKSLKAGLWMGWLTFTSLL